MRFRASVAPSPSTSHKSQKSESSEQLVQKQSSSEEVGVAPSSRVLEARRLREDALRLQEEREEQELKARKKVGVALSHVIVM